MVAAAAQSLRAGVAGALEKGVVGRDNFSLRVKDDDPVINTVDHRFQSLPLAADFPDQARHRVGHGIELFCHPRQRVRAFRGHTPFEIALGNQPRRGFKTLQAAQDRQPNHQSDGSHDDEGQGTGAGHHPAQVPRHRGADLPGVVVQNQDAIDFWLGIVALVALLAVMNRHDGSQNRSTSGLDHAAGSSAFRRIAMAGLAGGRVDPKIISRGPRLTGITFYAIAVQHYELFDTRLFTEALDHLRDQGAVIAHHLVLERGSDQFAFGERAAVCSFEKALKVTDRKDVGGDRASHNHRRGDTEREADRHAGKTQLHHDGTEMAG